MKQLTRIFLLLFITAITFSSCNKDDDDNSAGSNGQWDLQATVDLGGEFPVEATANISITGSTFTATVQTSEIAGQAEVHTASISGTVQNGNTLVITNETFTVTIGTDTNTVTLSGNIVITGDSLSGAGTISESIPGVGTINGTFTVTGSK